MAYLTWKMTNSITHILRKTHRLRRQLELSHTRKKLHFSKSSAFIQVIKNIKIIKSEVQNCEKSVQ